MHSPDSSSVSWIFQLSFVILLQSQLMCPVAISAAEPIAESAQLKPAIENRTQSNLSDRQTRKKASVGIENRKPSHSESLLQNISNPALLNGLPIETKERLDHLFSRIKPDAPGCFVSVVKNGEIVYGKGFGLANIETKTPFSENSVFELASCSKQFTAVAILILAEQGKLSVDDEARKYLPELPSTVPPITIRNLLAMSSGFTDYENELSEKDLASYTPPELMAWTVKQKIKFPAGAKYDYNNGNYVFLAMIVERVSGLPFREFLSKNIFQPAGMDNTFLMDGPGLDIANRVGGYKKSSKGWASSRLDTHIYGDGQVMTTPKDLAKWDSALNGGLLLKNETLQKAYVNQKLNNGSDSGYGFGLRVSSKEPGVVHHTGAWNGTSTYIERFLGRGSVQVLSNDENFPAKELGDKVGRIVFDSSNQFEEPHANHDRGAISNLVRWVGIVLF